MNGESFNVPSSIDVQPMVERGKNAYASDGIGIPRCMISTRDFQHRA